VLAMLHRIIEKHGNHLLEESEPELTPEDME